MFTRRAISLSIVVALLLSAVPLRLRGSSCGGAARANAEAAKSIKHDCHGCQARTESKVERLKQASTLNAAAHVAKKQSAFCCNDGKSARRIVIDRALPPSTKLLDVSSRMVASINHFFASVQSSWPAHVPAINGSPPYLAAAVQHTYLRTASILI